MEESQFHWKQIHRIEYSQDPLTPHQRSADWIPKEAKTVYPNEKSVEMRFCSTHKDTAQIYIYASRKDDGVIDVAEGLIKAGDQIIVRGKSLYCVDSINIESHWLSPPKIAQCPNGWSRIMFSTHGYHRFFVRLKFTRGIWYVDMVGTNI